MKTHVAMLGAILVTAVAGCSGGVYVRSAPQSPPVGAPTAAPRSTPNAGAAVAAARIVLTSRQVAAVRDHFATQGSSNGRGRNGGLPPGIARNLARGKPLPPGIAKQYLPADLIVVLPSLDSSLEYVVAARKLLLVDAATQVVRDVLIDVLF
jgi:hypothetical protein